ncbi:MAG: type III polyketide synthase [Chlamydiia bacterium]|nr:type III polyketide synthase [Chlamydiia bacterium]
MYAQILALETEVPPKFLTQEAYNSAMKRLLNLDEVHNNLLQRITSGSRIQKRHLVASDISEEGIHGTIFGIETKASPPTTKQRNDIYKEAAPELAASVCHKTLEQWGGDCQAITHVISVSCTGMLAPGIEFLLIEKLGLSPQVERLGINFMGCFGAFKGLAIAKALALESPKHRVLVVCTELCSLHVQENLSSETLVANSLFADGAAAMVVGVGLREGEKPLLELYSQKSEALDDTRDLMTWEAGDHGYFMRLSPTIPFHIKRSVSSFAQSLIGPERTFNQCAWAAHPGGKAILEGIAQACRLEKEQLSASWEVLYNYGNMSSPTFLFVLKEVLKTRCQKKWVIGLGFGPGLSIEGLLLKRVDENVAG